jgi:arsenate reductase
MSAARKKVLFVCLGNSCRSQMAEGFARAYGSDVIDAQSAGLAPALFVSPLTIEIMGRRNIDVSEAWPKAIDEAPGGPFDLIVNLSGYSLPGDLQPVREWTVLDPIRYGEEVYDQVAAKIEGLVMQLLIEFREQAAPAGEPEARLRRPVPK